MLVNTDNHYIVVLNTMISLPWHEHNTAGYFVKFSMFRI